MNPLVPVIPKQKGWIFRRLQKGGLGRWKAAQKYFILRPFAWIYQSFRILGILIKNRVTPKDMMEQRKRGQNERELIDALGLKMDRSIK